MERTETCKTEASVRQALSPACNHDAALVLQSWRRTSRFSTSGWLGFLLKQTLLGRRLGIFLRYNYKALSVLPQLQQLNPHAYY